VIVHAYEEWRTDCLQKFNGMFAFVVWDNRSKKLWIVRDRLGIKPLYYYQDKDVFIAASEIKAILKTGLVKPELNENVLDAYFSVGYVPGPETMFRGIRKLLPGSFMLLNGSEPRTHEYWDLSDIHPSEVSFTEALEQIEALLEDAVRKRLMSDVPLGAFLSGGLDSSVVVALMSKMVSDPVNTFTAAYHEGDSEDAFARIVADRFKTQHHEFFLEADNFFDSLKTLIEFAEEPIVEPAAISLYHIAKLARGKAIVLLSGEGGDELFGGYYLYQYMTKIDKLQKFLPHFLFPLFKKLGDNVSKLKYRKYIDWLTLALPSRYQGISSYLTESQKKFLYNPEFFESRSDYLESCFTNYFHRVQRKDPLSQMLYVDTKTWLVDDLLVKADKMTMAASVELRVPFLDHRLVEAAMELPSAYKINGNEGKFIIKKMAQSFLPDEIVLRKKMGFPVPTRDWFRGELMLQIDNILSNLKRAAWFRPNALDTLVAAHKADSEDLSKILMTLLVFNFWSKRYL